MNKIHTLLKSIVQPNSTIIIGFSGGPDSTLLLLGLSQIQQEHNLTLIAAHIDHQWRTESNNDAEWCKNFCVSLKNVIFEDTKLTQWHNIKYNGSKEAYARNIRRIFFNSLQKKHNATRIALAHHADDQLETFFIRIARGTSLTGLCSMSIDDGTYLRPFLSISKLEILETLQSHNVSFLIDSTNQNSMFLRNNIRLNLIPQLDLIDPRFKKNTLKLIDHLKNIESFIDLYTNQIIEKLHNLNTGYDLNIFLQQPLWLQHHILIQLLIKHKMVFNPSTSFLQEILRFLYKSKAHTHQISNNQIIYKKKQTFYFKSL